MSKVYSLMFAGVGGQGSLTAAEITSLTAVLAGYDVKQTEVHGVSQRGGSVETHVRFGEHVYSPTVTPGEADVVVALEKLEALRFAHYVDRAHGTVLVNDFEIIPASVANAEELYPHHALDYLRDQGVRLMVLPASAIARDLGDVRMTNAVMLGALSTLLPMAEEIWLKALRMRLPKKILEPNLKAFAAGRQVLQEVK